MIFNRLFIFRIKYPGWLAIAIGMFGLCTTVFANDHSVRLNDPHYSPEGFFDIHVCNWPDRKPFFLSLFSTYHYDKVRTIQVFNPDGSLLDTINKKRFKLIEKKGKPLKRVFIRHTSIPGDAQQGWYTTTVTMNDGRKVSLKDYVIIDYMDWAREPIPANNAFDVPIPDKLSWKSILGASHYKVFIKDLWQDGKTIFASKLIKKSEVKIKPGVLKPDGLYEWRVHARDSNGHVLLGDFNHGSLSPVMKFSTASD